MRDYHEVPSPKREYSLFLIRQTNNLDEQLLNALLYEQKLENSLISFERLIKGNKSALVIFGPKQLLLSHQSTLNLLELEDYTNIDKRQISVWDVVEIKNFPILEADEQFWYQLLLWPHKNNFHLQTRVAIISTDPERRKSLSQGLIKLPKAFSNDQLLDFYQKRSFQKAERTNAISSAEVLQLLSIPLD